MRVRLDEDFWAHWDLLLADWRRRKYDHMERVSSAGRRRRIALLKLQKERAQAALDFADRELAKLREKQEKWGDGETGHCGAGSVSHTNGAANGTSHIKMEEKPANLDNGAG